MNVNIQGLSSKDAAWLQGIHKTIAESRAFSERLEAQNKKPLQPISLASLILVQTQPKSMWPQSDIVHPGNWPADAEFGIEVETFHRDFGNRSGGKSIKYFTSKEDFEQWIIDERNYIASIDWAYSAHIRVYEWDWGPEFKRTEHL